MKGSKVKGGGSEGEGSEGEGSEAEASEGEASEGEGSGGEGDEGEAHLDLRGLVRVHGAEVVARQVGERSDYALARQRAHVRHRSDRRLDA